eukprot:9971601-Alexandrium_andersonii.AAC.1
MHSRCTKAATHGERARCNERRTRTPKVRVSAVDVQHDDRSCVSRRQRSGENLKSQRTCAGKRSAMPPESPEAYHQLGLEAEL